MSLMSCSRWRELARISPRYSFCAPVTGPALALWMNEANPITVLSGVRSSCDMLARNSLFRRLAS